MGEDDSQEFDFEDDPDVPLRDLTEASTHEEDEEDQEEVDDGAWLEVGGPLGRVPMPEFWLGGGGFGEKRGPAGSADWMLPDSDPRVDSYAEYIMERAWECALERHSDNLAKTKNKFVLTLYVARLLEQLHEQDKHMMAKNRPDPRFFVPIWMRAAKIASERMEEINQVAKALEEEMAVRDAQMFQEVVREHLGESATYCDAIDESQPFAEQSYVEEDQSPAAVWGRTSAQNVEELKKLKGLGLDFVVRHLPGASDVCPEFLGSDPDADNV